MNAFTLFFFLITTLALGASAEELPLLRRWVVFPYKTDEVLKTAADNAWWKSRERLTAKKKYLVASRQLMVQKDVFQPRSYLRPDDVKLLGNMLEADVIVTGYSEKRQFTLNVYLAADGRLFWTKHFDFHPSLKAADQLELASDKLTQEMLARVPYQGFTLVDPLKGKPVYDEGDKKYALVDVGMTEDVGPGTEIQWININLPGEDADGPLLGQSKLEVVGEGRVIRVKRGVATVEVLKVKSLDEIVEQTLVRIPTIAEKLAQSTDLAPGDRLAPQMLPTIINPVAPGSDQAKRTTLTFGTILSILGILALAF